MAKVSLRVYNHEIESMIEGGHLEEAVAHCQYILKTFPMHIETYRLLGKTFLEARRYADAGDIFQRALMAVPDDFVSHVGMSIIRDDEGKLDNAIWHMERAFEVQPSNPAIQGELRRLYGRRDGVEPPKIRLSRDALANMYAQGDLFNQAIAEIRSVLADDPNRPDLQVMLARAYYRAGQKVEAAEMASTLLKKFPYCLDALRILVDVLPGTARAENIQVYRQRLIMLDPYSSSATGSVFATDQVPDAAVTMERLEYKGSALPTSEPNWAASLGISLSGDKRSEPPPDWMKSAGEMQQPSASAPEPAAPLSSAVPAGNAVPEWMRSAGWQESTGTAQEPPAAVSEEAPTEPIAKADIPDWLKSMAPPEVTEDMSPIPESSDAAPLDGGDLPDWLSNLGGSPPAGSDKPPAEAQPEPSADSEQLASTQPNPVVQPGGEETLPPAPGMDVKPEPPAEAFPAESASFQPTGEVKPLDIGDDALGWLESLAAKQGAKPEELLTNPQQRSDEMPDWLRQSEAQPAGASTEPVAPAQPVTPTEEVIPPTDQGPVQPPAPVNASARPGSEEIPGLPTPPEEAGQPVKLEDDTLAWLEQLAANQATSPEQPLAGPDDRPETTPDWIQRVSAVLPAKPDEMPAPAEPAAPPTPPEPAGEDATITNWLSQLDKSETASQVAPPASIPEAIPTPQEELPDWLKGLEKPAAPPAESEPEKPMADLPDWLREPASPGQTRMLTPLEPPSGEPAAEQEMPAWMDVTAPVAKEIPPTTPEEWVPAEKPGAESTLPGPVESVPPAPAESSAPAAEIPVQVEPPAPVPIPANRIAIPEIKGTGQLAHVPPQDKDAELLSAAQAALEAGSLEEAMKTYAKLIKKGRLLDEVIHDLREAIYRYPVDVIIWQTMGDAYMRANRLQDALDAYTKAEELLR